MKTTLILLSIVLITTECRSQKKQSMLQDFRYFTVAPNKRAGELSLTGDSLVVTESINQSIVKRHAYAVQQVEKKDDLYLLCVKRSFPPSRSKLVVTPPPPYGLVVLSFSKERDKLFVLHEDKLWFATVEECQKANDGNRYGDKYFDTYYSASLFGTLTQGQNVKSMDKETTRSVADAWVADLNRESPKVLHTQSIDMYGTRFLQDNLTKSLIQYHINPLASIQDLDMKIKEYDIELPPIARIGAGRRGLNQISGSDTSGIRAPTLH